jgi:DNA gyrase subunit B
MYIGTTSLDGVHHCLNEIIDNCIDEALAGFCTKIVVRIEKNGYFTVVDNGRGIPTEEMPAYKKSALEIILTKLHAGAKFDTRSYKVSGGLHGVGSSVVNALSDHMIAEVRRGNKVYRQEYHRGIPAGPVKVMAKSELGLFSETGTAISFLLDKEIFLQGITLDTKRVLKQLRERAFLTKSVFLYVYDDINNIKKGYFFEGGIVSLVEDLNLNKHAFHDIIYFKESKGDVEVEIAMQYNDSIKDNVLSFVNVINTKEGGTHVTGFRMALTKVLNDYGNKQGFIKKENLSGEDTLDGLTAIVYIKMPSTNLQFEGQTKEKLGNAEVQTIVQQITKEHLERYFEEHPSEAREIMAKALLTQQARLAAKAARDSVIRKSALEGSTLPGKLADCKEKDPAKSEIFIVEGDSAGGSAKQGRDRKFQAILPLRGKILNSEKSYLDKVMQFKELRDLVVALGTGISDMFNYEKLRYHKVVIMTDADVDGEHIMTLILTFFFRHMPVIVEKGHIFVAQPPLYKISQGKRFVYVYSDDEKDAVIKKDFGPNYTLQRYKGLGEMNPEQLWETTMNPENRVLKQIQVPDAEEADKVFSMLMGEEVPPRKKFIQTHAKMATLDI